MSDLNIVPNNALVVVADGEGARMFRAVRAGESFHLKESEPVEPQNLDDDGPAGARPPEQDKLPLPSNWRIVCTRWRMPGSSMPCT